MIDLICQNILSTSILICSYNSIRLLSCELYLQKNKSINAFFLSGFVVHNYFMRLLEIESCQLETGCGFRNQKQPFF